MPTPYDSLRALLSDRPIAFHPAMARLLGGINEALLFQQLAYWSDKGADPGWIYKGQAELEAETTLSDYQQLQARKKLKALGVIQEERRGVPARLYYRIHWEAVFDLFAASESRFPETGNLDSDQLADKRTGNSGSISESTQRQQQRDLSKGPHPQMLVSREQRSVIEAYARDYATELRDESRIGSTVTRLTRIFANSGLELGSFLDMLQDARQATQKHSASIRKEAADGSGRKSKMSYFLAVVEDLVEKRGA